mmetsp:Transcript_4682/g.15524  ORF Transcript_4682/g.15524 Transcript_4682/m.15524 type:complete len:234 (+) Transcript_4682:363-1064(+)
MTRSYPPRPPSRSGNSRPKAWSTRTPSACRAMRRGSCLMPMSSHCSVMRVWLHASAMSTRSPGLRAAKRRMPWANTGRRPPLARWAMHTEKVVRSAAAPPCSSVHGCTTSMACESVTTRRGAPGLAAARAAARARSKRALSRSRAPWSSPRAAPRSMRCATVHAQWRKASSCTRACGLRSRPEGVSRSMGMLSRMAAPAWRYLAGRDRGRAGLARAARPATKAEARGPARAPL